MAKNSKKLNKKAFGDVVSALILFIAVIGISTGLVIAMKNYAVSTQDSMRNQNEVMNNQLRTIIDISHVSYNSTSNDIYIYIKNLGSTQLISKDLAIFVSEEYMINFNVFSASNESEIPRIILPGETVVIVTNKVLVPQTHLIRVVSGYGGTGANYYINI